MTTCAARWQRVLFGRNRTESARWTAFRSFYAFTAFYCIPGAEGAHEKGGVEGDGGRFRRAHLTPMPQVDSLEELNARLAEADRADLGRHIEFRPRTVGQDLAAEQQLLAPLPVEPFDCALELSPRVDRYARIMVRQCRYSVPAYLIGSRVRVRLSASHLEVYDGPRRVAVHVRLIGRGGEHLVLDHYLEILKAKPGAMSGSLPLATARAEGVFTPDHEAFWARARALHGEPAATKALIEVLLLHRRMSGEQVIAGIRAALAQGTVNPDLVAIEARKAAPAATAAPADDPPTVTTRQAGDRRGGGSDHTSPGVLITLPARGATAPALPADQRPAPSVHAYDQLLTRARPACPPPQPQSPAPPPSPAAPTGTEQR